MRVEITYKFVMGFFIVVASIVALNYLVPAAALVPHYMEQTLSTACALLVGLLLGWIFSKAFTANILVLKSAAERISDGDLSQTVYLPNNMLPDETAELADSLNRVTTNLRSWSAISAHPLPRSLKRPGAIHHVPGSHGLGP